MVLIDYDLIDMIFLITVMHVFALDMVNSNLLFGISSVVFFDNRYVSHSVRFPPPSPPFLEEGWEWGWVSWYFYYVLFVWGESS